MKLLKDNKNNTDKNAFSKIVNNYENLLSKYLPVITAQAKIFWDLGNYDTVESILKSNDIQEIYEENPTWKINLGHAFKKQISKRLSITIWMFITTQQIFFQFLQVSLLTYVSV